MDLRDTAVAVSNPFEVNRASTDGRFGKASAPGNSTSRSWDSQNKFEGVSQVLVWCHEIRTLRFCRITRPKGSSREYIS